MFETYLDEVDNYSSQPDILLSAPFVPTEENILGAMLKLAEVSSKDVLYDLGSGDGRILIAAARDRNTRGVGIDLDPTRIADAMEEAGWAGVECLVDFIEGDIFDVDLSDATVVTLYLLQSVNVLLRPRLLNQLRPGTRIVSHAFNMGDWKPDDVIKLDGTNIFKWIVPAQVSGAWEWKDTEGRTCRVELQQRYQEITGSAWLDGVASSLEDATIFGDRLDLKVLSRDSKSKHEFTLIFNNEGVVSVSAN